MTYPTVNLLRKNEQRHQGAVSQKFIVSSAIIVPLLLIAVLGGINLIQYRGIKSSLLTNRAIWKEMEPRLAIYKNENKGLAVNRTALGLFGGWEKSQPAFVKLLNDIQETVPAAIQFKRLSVRSKPSPAMYTAPEDMELTFDLVIEGQSQGERAENQVIDLRRELLNCAQIAATFDSLKLASMRQSRRADGESIREFRIEGETVVVEEGL